MISIFRAPTLRLKAPTAIIFLGLSLAMTGCGATTGTGASAEGDTVTDVVTEVVTEEVTSPATPEAVGECPEHVISLSPAATAVIDAAGAGGRLVAVDTNTSTDLTDLADLPRLEMMDLDVERILSLHPDLLVVSEITTHGNSDAIGQIEAAGVHVLSQPTATSLADIESSIGELTTAVCEPENGQHIVADMQSQIEEVRQIGQTITEPKSVLVEIAPAPDIFSTGHGTFLDEMITIIGAKNVLENESGWVPVTEEAAISANPDVILTNVNWTPDPVNEILARPGFANVNAVVNHRVYQIDNDASSQPNQNVVIALKEMARAVYPEQFASLD